MKKPLVSESILLISTTSFVIELVVLSLLIFGYKLKRENKFRQHGITMTIALLLHLGTIFGWMITSFAAYFFSPNVQVNLANPLILTTFVHVFLGTIAASFGVWLVASWHLQMNVRDCFGRKRIMLTTIAFWSIAITLGVVLYVAVILS